MSTTALISLVVASMALSPVLLLTLAYLAWRYFRNWIDGRLGLDPYETEFPGISAPREDERWLA